ncbi:MAG: RelA/SpoT family protein [bacterium]
MGFNELLEKFKNYASHVESDLLQKAYQFSQEAHSNQNRASGEQYFVHCTTVAEILTDFKMDLPTVAAGLLHDILEDTPVSPETLTAEFGPEITSLVQGVTKLETLKFSSIDEAQAENWRRMILATAKDIRVILIKLADRLHNMRTLEYLQPEKRMQIARETFSLYAPLAQRLGMFQLKSELEDLSFRHLHPDEFAELSAKVQSQITARETALEGFKKEIEKHLAGPGIQYRVLSRTKNLFSIYRKMERQKKPFEEIQDSLGIRIITDTIANCYALLGMVHSVFKPVAGAFTDYIAIPKMNLYQSLHTTVVGPSGDIVEIQIRTDEMHRTSEYGIAAHWRYKLGDNRRDAHMDEKLDWLRQWIEWLQDLTSPREFLESLETDLDLRQVFVFTPKGEVKALPVGSTPLDFAYAVHSDIGNTCVGAKVNNKMVKLDYELKSGDICAIVTRKNSVPRKDWLQIVKTARARSKIRHTLKEKGLSLE